MLNFRKKLTDEEFNLISKWTERTKLNDCMDIAGNEDHDYFFYMDDIQQEVSLEEGFSVIADAIAYPLSHEGFTEKEGEMFMNLLKEFGVSEKELEYIKNLKDD